MAIRPILDPPATVMLVGSIHFAANHDLVDAGGFDATTPRRQHQLDDLVERLAAFGPTDVAIEAEPEHQATIDERYQAYLAGDRELGRGEDEQIGFRLARRGGLDRVLCVDRMWEFFTQELMDLVESDPGATTRLTQIQAAGEEEMAGDLAAPTIVDLYRRLNDPARRPAGLAPYMLMVPWSSDDRHLGAEAVGNWYVRNLQILANVLRHLDPGDRMALVIGGGHVPPLAHFIELSPELELAEAADYLG